MKQMLKSLILTLAMTIVTTSVCISDEQSYFLAESRIIPQKKEWNREFLARNKATIYCGIENEQGMMSVTLVADRSYQAIFNGDNNSFRAEDVLFTVDVPEGYFESSIEIPRSGSYWFIIENGTRSTSEIFIACIDSKKIADSSRG